MFGGTVTDTQFNAAFANNTMATLVMTSSGTESITGTLKNADGSADLANNTEFSIQLGATTFKFKLLYAAKTIKLQRTA